MKREPTVPEIDGFIHEPARLRLLVFLSVLERADFAYLLRESGLSRGNLSVQMTKLSEAGFVNVEKSFVDNRPRTTYSLTAGGRRTLRAYKRTLVELLSNFS
jgi:DNA-binding MarR family transcriptional regulator